MARDEIARPIGFTPQFEEALTQALPPLGCIVLVRCAAGGFYEAKLLGFSPTTIFAQVKFLLNKENCWTRRENLMEVLAPPESNQQLIAAEDADELETWARRK